MLKLAVLADDLTGALDTGVQFAKKGIKTSVTCDLNIPKDCEVAVCDMETRHLTAIDAYTRTKTAAQNALDAGAKYIYIKTDSGLRGNIGAELAAAAEVYSDRLLFVPSYPENGRVTTGGVHYINGVPVSRSIFGRDPLNPVFFDRVDDILKLGTDMFMTSVSDLNDIKLDFRGIIIADAVTDNDLRAVAKKALEDGFRVFAGCAGFAKYLDIIINFKRSRSDYSPKPTPMLVICGSISPVSLEQVNLARDEGVPSFLLRELIKRDFEDTVSTALKSSGAAILASAYSEDDVKKNDSLEVNISDTLAKAAYKAVREQGASLFVIGGDTLMAVMREFDNMKIIPVSEPVSGTVLCRAVFDEGEFTLITKSGSFGTPDTIADIINKYAGVK